MTPAFMAQPVGLRSTAVDVSSVDSETALATLWQRQGGGDAAVLLGHAVDGVVWGALRGGTLDLSSGESPPFRADTLVDLRMFDGNVELRIWQHGANRRGCVVREEPDDSQYVGYLDRSYELLRTPGTRPDGAAFVVLEGVAGQRHAPPGLPTTDGRWAVPHRLRVRHYFQADHESGLLRMADHRLLALMAGN